MFRAAITALGKKPTVIPSASAAAAAPKRGGGLTAFFSKVAKKNPLRKPSASAKTTPAPPAAAATPTPVAAVSHPTKKNVTAAAASSGSSSLPSSTTTVAKPTSSSSSKNPAKNALKKKIKGSLKANAEKLQHLTLRQRVKAASRAIFTGGGDASAAGLGPSISFKKKKSSSSGSKKKTTSTVAASTTPTVATGKKKKSASRELYRKRHASTVGHIKGSSARKKFLDAKYDSLSAGELANLKQDAAMAKRSTATALAAPIKPKHGITSANTVAAAKAGEMAKIASRPKMSHTVIGGQQHNSTIRSAWKGGLRKGARGKNA